MTTSNKIIYGLLIFSSIILVLLFIFIRRQKKKNQLMQIFQVIFGLLIFWMICSIIQMTYTNILHIEDTSFIVNIAYFGLCFLPVAMFLMSLIFARTKISFKKSYVLLFVIPILSLIVLWTNDFHHLFYKEYTMNISDTSYGIFFYIYFFYSYTLYGISLFTLIKYSIKNSGLFSNQAIFVLIGSLIPIVTNLLGTLNIVEMSVHVTPITFALTAIFLSLAMFKFSFLKTTPIALQRIVDRISDSYIVINENYEVSDFNQTLVNTFNIEDTQDIRGKSFQHFLSECHLNSYMFKDHIDKIKDNDKTEIFELFIKKISKYFNVEITSIVVNKQFLGILILFKDITQHVKDMQTIKNNQDTLMENERLASLGQLIGGIAHNLKTPIMSIAGATEGLSDLVKEYDASIGDPEVNEQDHHEIAHDMSIWIEKIKSYTEYMSDIITTVKGQAVTLGADEEYEFTVKELINRVDILMKHELKNALIYLNVSMNADENTTIHGDINSLVQVINNMISNSIQAYNGKTEQKIDMTIFVENNSLVISIKDYAGGLPDIVEAKLFKEMVTTKGKNGTGLGLYMSYSNIKARFNGDITFDTDSKGTTFNIILPL